MQSGSLLYFAPPRKPDQGAMFSILPFGEASLTRTLSAEIRQTKGEPGPQRCFVTDRRSPGIEAGPGDVGAKRTDPILLGCGVNLPKMSGKRHQGLLTKVLGVEIPFINGSGGAGHRSGA